MKSLSVELWADSGRCLATKVIERLKEHPWMIEDPWGATHFYGTAVQVRALMRRRIKEAGETEEREPQ